MKYTKFLFIFFFLIVGIPTLLKTSADANNMDLGTALGQQGNTQALEDLEKELEKASQKVDTYVASLPPEEQVEFHKAVEKLTEEIENMSPEEFAQFFEESLEFPQFFEESFGEELPLEEEEKPETKEEKEIKEEEFLAPEPEVKEERGEQSKAISLIDTIITHTNSFGVKTTSSPDLPGKIEFWGKQNTIKEWPATLTWKNFRQQLENFSQQLHKLKDQDPQTKKYKYLDDFIENESLYNNLAQLKTKISLYEPKIEIPEFGLEKLSNESKQAVQKTVNAYTEALYALKILEELTK
ncbi:MAG: hypothetical protein WCD44_03005, partial [Candidatus Babeliales bacterium]